ncbi:MAG: hypothetical protein QOK28_2509 [Actinomycetota bacterium]|jgi:hypothetical protein
MRRAFFAVFVAAVTLASAGAGLLAFAPSSAHAEPMQPAPADFTLKPGESTKKDFTNVLVGSAEARPTADGCRNNPAIALTCGVYRIKLVNRTKGYFLRISTFWVDKDAAGNSVPDVDTYLFDGPTSSFDYNQVGGVSGAMPEQIKLVDPKQDEYDFVLGVYAGAITSYSIAVEYTNAASAPTAGIHPDFVLTPHDAPIRKSITSTLVVPTIAGQAPDSCRTDPTQDLVCDVYRIKLNRNLAKDAVNFVVITLNWDAVVTPDLSTPAAGLGGEQQPNLDMYVYDTATHILDGTGGNLFSLPERAGFVAAQDEYDLTIQSKRGVAHGYQLEMFMTDELFAKPNELLDPVTGQPIGTPPVDDGSAFVGITPSTPGLVPQLALAPVEADSQIAGIGLDTTEQFDAADLQRLGGQALRNTAATGEPPSTAVLVLLLLVVPIAALGGGVVALRRRHNVLF